MSNDWRDPKAISLADLIDHLRARLKRRRGHLDPIYYTLHDAAVDESLLEEINLLRLRAIESSGRDLADANSKKAPLP